MDTETTISLTDPALVRRESGKSKNEMRKKQLRGEYGNYFLSWKSVKEWKEDFGKGKYTGNLWLSQSQKSYGPVELDIPPKDLEEKYKQFVNKGFDPKYITITQFPPADWITLNAEVQLTPEGLTVDYSEEKIIHRKAFEKNPKTIKGLNAKLLLQKHMDPTSYDGIMELLDTYKVDSNDPSRSCILEIHCFDRNLGTIPGRNTIIGEVRNY